MSETLTSPFPNAVPEYYWKIAETAVNVSENETSVQLEVSIIRSSLTDPKFCKEECPCANFRLLNESVDSKLRWICTSIVYPLKIYYAISDFYLNYMLLSVPTNAIVGYKLGQDRCCFLETNNTEITCIVNITALPLPSMVGDQSVLVLELVPTDYSSVSIWNQLLVFVEHIGAGMWVTCLV